MVAYRRRLVGYDERSLSGASRRRVEGKSEQVGSVECAYDEVHFGGAVL